MNDLAGTVVLFDCDGVLVDSDDSVVSAWSRWAEEHDLVAAEVLALVHGRRSSDTVASLITPQLRAAALERIDRYEMDAAAGVRPVPGAAELLASLPVTAWAVVTSGRRDLAAARLRAAGLPSPGVLVAAEDVLRGKPDPEGYLAAARLLGCQAGASIVVEDSPDGIRAARAAGAGAVLGVGARARAAAPDRHVEDLTQVTWTGHGLSVAAPRSIGRRASC
jgi:sugar-phosphatase